MDMTERRKRILRAVVEHYIETAEPVGSKIIADLAQLDCSSATIRNEMATLEKMGYLEQPHTSAGRIPSPAGYRFYVNELMEKHKLSMQETERINEAMHLKPVHQLPRLRPHRRSGSHLYLSVRPADGGSQQLYRGGHD